MVIIPRGSESLIKRKSLRAPKTTVSSHVTCFLWSRLVTRLRLAIGDQAIDASNNLSDPNALLVARSSRLIIGSCQPPYKRESLPA
jgi:hypothetical protein